MVIQVSVYHSSHLKKTLVHIRFLIPTDMEVYSKGLELERFLIDLVLKLNWEKGIGEV